MKNNDRRFNKGNVRGRSIIKLSLEELGCGRSVLADKNGVIMCGNEVFKAATELGKKIVTIETDGDILVVVKRTDIDACERKGLELSLVDNLSQEKNLSWDADALIESMHDCLSFDPRKWGGHSCLVKELDLTELLKDDVTVKTKKEKKEEPIKKHTQLSLFD